MHQIPTCMKKKVCSLLHFRTFPGRIISVVDAVGSPPRFSLPGLCTRSLLLDCWLLWASSCLLPQGTFFIQRQPPHLSLSGKLSFPSGDRPQPITDWHMKAWLPCLSGAINDRSEPYSGLEEEEKNLWNHHWKTTEKTCQEQETKLLRWETAQTMTKW